jgi:hypothetical protein
VDQSVRLEAADREGIQHVIQYFLRCPFSQARRIEVTDEGKVLYKMGDNRIGRLPEALRRRVWLQRREAASASTTLERRRAESSVATVVIPEGREKIDDCGDFFLATHSRQCIGIFLKTLSERTEAVKSFFSGFSLLLLSV